MARKRKLDVKKYKAILEAERERLRADLKRLEDRAAGRDRLQAEPVGQDFDEPGGDAASETVERAQSMALGANLRELYDEINAALAKIENGTYGICDSCGKEITKKRLNALPWATLCKDCRSGLSGM
ncbi:MAG: TraR/DksA C4-type zinc finger protein [Armatimonadetes bacterium]|nr:TraR/DksA C4-type zinc finger protein [Armatimonadota bacterium]